MRRIKLVVAYDGTKYSGWQLQPNAVTVEQVLNKALSGICNEDIRVIGASRTDAGVHALGNIAVFDTESRIPAEKFAYALNSHLPDDVSVQESCEVAADFHPRHCNTVKTYEYKILNRTFPLPLMRSDTLFFDYPLDLEAMNEAAQYLVGEHDFKSFCSVNTQAETTVRTIYSLEVIAKPVGGFCEAEAGSNGGSCEEMHGADSVENMKRGREIIIRVRGNGFLYNMVRIIAGTLIEVGNKRRTPESVKEALEACKRECAGPTAPPQGLTLAEIKYL